MEQQQDRSIRVRNTIIGVLVIVAVAVLAVPWTRDKLFGNKTPASPGDSIEPHAAGPASSARDAIDDSVPATTVQAALEQDWTRAVGSPPVWPGDLSAPVDCDAIEHGLAEVCAALDAASDPALVARSGGACNLLKQASRDLAANPPDVSSELSDHQLILSNVFHVFRVLGRKRLQMLRETLDGQRGLAEALSLAQYRWLASREDCGAGRTASVRIAALYDYAGFAFTTMGGQAYLRRRAPRIESLACFYALQVVDRTVAEGRNPQGLDPRPEIRRCLALVRTQDFVFTDHYVESLEAMARRWPATES